jgi:8-oxo-dGTP pyrophosphatase MutT (NUDIX family)
MWSSRFDPAAITERLARAAGNPEAWADGARREHAAAGAKSSRPAAVLLPLLRLGADPTRGNAVGSPHSSWHLLFIRRAEHPHDRHSGEVAFPGGRVDPQDPDAVATALREAEEEIGLDPSLVQVLGRLPAFHTVSGYRVTPVVGLIPWPLSLRPDPTEVAEVFTLPLDWLREPAHRQTRLWPFAGHPLAREVIFYQEREGRRLWGVTAWITLDFLRCLEP